LLLLHIELMWILYVLGCKQKLCVLDGYQRRRYSLEENMCCTFLLTWYTMTLTLPSQRITCIVNSCVLNENKTYKTP